LYEGKLRRLICREEGGTEGNALNTPERPWNSLQNFKKFKLYGPKSPNSVDLLKRGNLVSWARCPGESRKKRKGETVDASEAI